MSAFKSYTNFNQYIAVWLFIVSIMVIMMVVIGGYTRLSNAGLSIVEWKPITGTVPPLDEAGWLEEFTKYKSIPQFQQINFNITLKQFKTIYLIEYFHRLMGRITGLVFLMPLILFAYKKALSNSLILKLGLIFILGGMQGFIGWYMVKSGLKVNTDVSHYRLTLHLVTAFVIFGLIFWEGLAHLFKYKIFQKEKACLLNHSVFTTLLILLQVTVGGFVAGTNAGYIYNDFPLMNGEMIPSNLLTLKPLYKNFLENITTIQFVHRVIALILFVNIVSLFYRVRQLRLNILLNKSIMSLLLMLLIQLGLGVITLVYQVPLIVALLHQLGSIFLFAISLFINYILYDSVNNSLKHEVLSNSKN